MRIRSWQALATLVSWCALSAAHAGPVVGGRLGFIADGTSRTILFTGQSRLSACLDRVAGGAQLHTIGDGTSHTLQFGGGSLTLRVGTSLVYQPISNIQDGTSNTIFIGTDAPDERCFAGDTAVIDLGGSVVDGTSNTIVIGDGARVDLCLRDVRFGIQDGTSNTIVFGETQHAPTCFRDVQVTTIAPAAVPEPGTLMLASAGLALAFGLRRRRGG